MLVVVILTLMLVFTFMVLVVIFFVMHFTNSPFSLDIIPPNANIDIELCYLEASKGTNCCLGGLNWFHECFFTKNRDFFRHLVENDPAWFFVGT